MRSPVKSLSRISNPRLPVVLLIILPVSFFVSCAGGPQPAPDSAGNPVVVASMSLVGDTSFDCSGFVLETYRRAGIDLAPFMNRYTGNGVARLFALALDYGLLTGDNLQPGDVIFWDNTYDRNGDGVWNDPLTHTGIVTAVNADGTVEFTHSHYRDGVVMIQLTHLKLQQVLARLVPDGADGSLIIRNLPFSNSDKIKILKTMGRSEEAFGLANDVKYKVQ